MTEPTVVHLVPHTHWDREWYEPFQTFRMRLVELIDQLLERMSRDERLRFTLDGQAATVDDYLEVRPEAEPLIRRLIAEGRLAIGPWQILLDEFLVSGETIVRNLELGWARAEELGRAMPVGYLPDMFGHVAQMPQILRRAGIDRAVVWRGVPEAIASHAFAWTAPDGSTVEATYLVGGYGNGAYLFDVPDRLPAKLAEYARLNRDMYGERSVLAMYGTDHAVPSPRLADLIDEVNAADGPVSVRMETLADYVAAQEPTDAAWTGELRSGIRANMLMNVISARVDLKAAAARAERALERYAEPLTALHGGPWPTRLLELAWRRVVENSAHDSICGCSHDAVVRQVIGRYAEAEQIAMGLVQSTLRRIAERAGAGHVAVVNPSPFDREDLVELDVAVPPGWTSIVVRVGDRNLPTQEVGRPGPVLADLRMAAHEIPEFFRRRRHGRELFGRMINGTRIDPGDGDGPPRLIVLVDAVPTPEELDIEELLAQADAVTGADPDAMWDLVVAAPDRRLVVARVPVPALGWARCAVADGADGVAESTDHPVEVADGRLANGLVTIEVAADGTFRLRGGGATLDGVGRIVDGGDFGDSYNYGPPALDTVIDRPASVERQVVERGPLRGALRVVRRYDWPVGLGSDGSARTAATVGTVVTTRLELRAGEPFVRIELDFENRSRDHRVRWHVPLPSPVSTSSAEGQFAVVERGLTVEGGRGEVPLPTFPAVAFVAVDGLSVLLDQVTEYELVDDGRELALTVLRSFGLISRNANPYREDPAGPETPIPEAQLLGDRTVRFALYPHAGGWADADTVAVADRYRHPFQAVRTLGTPPPAAGGDPGPDTGTGLRLEGQGVVLSALRRRDDWLEARLVNEGASPVTALLHGAIDRAIEVDLLGRIGAALPMTPGRLTLDLAPWEIRTVRLRPSS